MIIKPKYRKAAGGPDIPFCKIRVKEAPELARYDADGDGIVILPVEEKRGEKLSKEQQEYHARFLSEYKRPVMIRYYPEHNSTYLWTTADKYPVPKKEQPHYPRFMLQGTDETTIRNLSDTGGSVRVLESICWRPIGMKDYKHKYNFHTRIRRIKRQRDELIQNGLVTPSGKLIKSFSLPSPSSVAELFFGYTSGGRESFLPLGNGKYKLKLSNTGVIIKM